MHVFIVKGQVDMYLISVNLFPNTLCPMNVKKSFLYIINVHTYIIKSSPVKPD